VNKLLIGVANSEGTEMRNQGIVVVSYKLLLESLGLPPDAEIVTVGQDFQDQTIGVFRVLVQHSGLPEVGEGALSPVVGVTKSIDGMGNTVFGWKFE